MPVQLSDLLKDAALGDVQAARNFLEAALKRALIVPTREQEVVIKEMARYPNPLLDVMALQGDGKIFVPVFSDAEAMSLWSSLPLKHRNLSLGEVIGIIPEDWWVAVNPGSEFNKEFSPWELKQLKDGENGIQAVLDESDPLPRIELTVQTVGESEFVSLKESLKQFALSNNLISKIWLLRSLGESADGKPLHGLRIGVLLKPPKNRPPKAIVEETHAQLNAVIGRELIGAEDFHVVCGIDAESLALSAFKGSIPFYNLEPRFSLSKLLNLLRK